MVLEMVATTGREAAGSLISILVSPSLPCALAIDANPSRMTIAGVAILRKKGCISCWFMNLARR